MKKIIALIGFALAFVGCGEKTAPLPTVEKVELNRYLGTWYEIARYDAWFERGCANVTANYTLKADGDIKVTNRCTVDGKEKIDIGSAYATDATNSKLKVSFFKPFYGNYHVLMLGENYEYVVIGEPKREYFWILSRQKTITPELKATILAKLPELGYGAEPLIWTVQE